MRRFVPLLLALNLAVLCAAGATAVLRDDRPDAAEVAGAASDGAGPDAGGDEAPEEPVTEGEDTDDVATDGQTAASAGAGQGVDPRGELPLGDLAEVIQPVTATNVGIAVALSRAAFPDGGAPDAIIARDDGWVDALASAGVQGALDAPLLLTPAGELDSAVVAELARLGTERVTIVGGPAAVSTAAEQQLADLGLEVDRLAGFDRVDTSVRLAEQHLPDATTALLVRSEPAEGDPSRGFVDALAAGGWAASSGMPMLLTRPFVLDDVVAAYLERSAIERVIVIGGREAVEEQVEADLAAVGVEVQRIFGVDRYDTAVRIAEAQGLAEGADRALLVEGDGDRIWAAGFASAAYANRAGAPILLAADGAVPAATDAALSATQDLELVCAPGVAASACATARELALAGD